MRNNQPVTGVEFVLKEGAAIISRTDKKGRITDCNQEFVEASGFAREELIGQPHNLVRHPDMPEEAFRDLWTTLRSGRPWSGLVKNRRKDGSFYWVKATATPLPDQSGYFSVRTKAGRAEIAEAEALYARMRGDKKLRLHEGRPADWRSRLPELRLGARLWLMLGIPLLTLSVIGAENLLCLREANQAVSNLYNEKLVPINNLAEVNDLVQSALLETLAVVDGLPDAARLNRFRAEVRKDQVAMEKSWQAYLKKTWTRKKGKWPMPIPRIETRSLHR